MWLEVMQGDDPHDSRSERSRELGIAVVGEVTLPVGFIVMDLSLEGLAHLACGAGKIDHHATGIYDVNLEAVRLEPAGNRVEVSLR